MKNFITPKHIIVSVLSFFIVLSLFFPSFGTAQVEGVIYDGLMRPGEGMSIRSWGKSFILGNAIDIALALPCGGENDKEKIWGEGGQCVPPLTDIAANLQGDKPRMSGGLASMSSMAIHYGVTEPMVPTDMALFLDDTFNNTIFSSEPSYAQSMTDLSRPTAFFQQATLTLWKTSRNLALGLLGVLLAVAGLSILFRSKLSPQVTVTISNVLPYLPISIIGIVLSYPIMAVAYNLLSPLMSIAYSIGSAVFEALAPASQVQPELGLYTMLSGIYGILLIVTTWAPAVAIGAVMAFPLVVLILVAVYLILWGLLKYVYELAKTTVLFVFYVTVFPLLSAIAILPGKQNIISLLFKKVIANLLALPIMTILVLVGLGFIASMANPSGGGPGDLQYISSVGGTIFSAIIKFAIGFGIIQQSFKARKIMEDALGAGGDLMSNLKGGAAAGPGGPGGKR